MTAPWLQFADAAAHRFADRPDYFRDAFPYTLPPMVQFEREPVPLDLSQMDPSKPTRVLKR